MSKRSRDVEALGRKAFVPQQRPAKVAYPDQRHRPIAIRAQNPADLLDQLPAAVADAWIAELTEKGKVFADLSVCKPQQLTKLC